MKMCGKCVVYTVCWKAFYLFLLITVRKIQFYLVLLINFWYMVGTAVKCIRLIILAQKRTKNEYLHKFQYKKGKSDLFEDILNQDQTCENSLRERNVNWSAVALALNSKRPVKNVNRFVWFVINQKKKLKIATMKWNEKYFIFISLYTQFEKILWSQNNINFVYLLAV